MSAARTGDQGLSLLELTAVLAIFSVVAILALQMLSAGLQNRQRLGAASAAAQSVAAFSAVLRRDVEAGAAAGKAFDVSRNGRSFAMTTSAAGADPAALEQVTWQFDPATSTLTRSTRAFADTAAPVQTVLIEGVTDWRVMAMTEGGGWVAAETWRGLADWDQPAAVSVSLRVDALGDIRVLVAR